MPPPPPPPPPVGGPPPPPAMPNFKSSGGAPDRGALLSQIRVGARLKKTTTNDRSAPIVGNKPNNASAGAPSSSATGSSSNGAFGGGGGGGPMGLGGLFAGGMPKLKPTGQREALGVKGASSSPSPPKESPPKESPSPQRTIGGTETLAQALANRFNEKNAPAVSAKPAPKFSAVKKSTSPERLNSLQQHESVFPKDVSPPQKGRAGPPLPTKPPVASVNRTGSQNQTKRPTHKPPPPPNPSNTKFGTIGHSKRSSNTGQTQQLVRRQSFGAPESNQALSVTKPQAAPPPPPPRNMSVPSGMNTLHQRNAPPIPPSSHHHHQNTKSKPAVPAAKPPPPPNKTTSRSTPHLASMVGGGSAVRAGSFESRFTFHNINDLSVTYDPTPNKRYPSKSPAKKPHQRRAPAPPQVAAVS